MSKHESLFFPEPGLVLMMCGISGSGKTTFAMKLEKMGFNRLSIDEEIWANFGRFGIDYNASEYVQYQDEARKMVEKKLLNNLRQQQPTVLDLSFWCKSERDRVSNLIMQEGGHYQIIYLKVPEEVLKKRLKQRSKRFDANAAFTITEDVLNLYASGFEAPKNEGEIIIACESEERLTLD